MLVYLCPSDRKYACSWEGRSDDILHHFEEEHDDLLQFSDTFTIDIDTPSENRLFLIEEEIYLVQTFVSEKTLEVRLRYLGPQKMAERITYNILLRINCQMCHPRYILVTKSGSISVDLKQIELDSGEITSVDCTLNINKDVVFDSEDDEVITSKSESLVAIDQYEVISKKSRMTISSRTYSLDDTTDSLSATSSPKGTRDVSLYRSKTISSDELKKKNLKRAKSTVSLCSIREVESDPSPNCTECGVVLAPPIYICPCERSFCLNCQKGVCRYCSEKVTFQRNIVLEERFNKFLLPCKYKNNGCPEKLVYNEINDHINSCTFCDYRCPISGCHFEGQFKHVYKHLKLIHGTTKILESFILVFQNIPEAFLANEEKGIFYCFVQYLDDSVRWEARFCGPKGRRFFCELKFKDGKLKQPVLLSRNENENNYSIRISLQELKRLKLKAKNAILAITC